MSSKTSRRPQTPKEITEWSKLFERGKWAEHKNGSSKTPKPQIVLRRSDEEKKNKEKIKTEQPQLIKQLLEEQGMKETDLYNYILTLKAITEAQEKTITSLRRYLKPFQKQQQEYSQLRQEYQALQEKYVQLEQKTNATTVTNANECEPPMSTSHFQEQTKSNSISQKDDLEESNDVTASPNDTSSNTSDQWDFDPCHFGDVAQYELETISISPPLNFFPDHI